MSLTVSASRANDIRTDYLNLLVTQLRNQDPLEPLDNNQMSMQLAQLAQLEQLEGMRSTFQQVLLTQQCSQATELIGKEITFLPADSEVLYRGRVEQVEIVGGQVCLRVGSYAVDPATITSIAG